MNKFKDIRTNIWIQFRKDMPRTYAKLLKISVKNVYKIYIYIIY